MIKEVKSKINPIRKMIVKTELLKGVSARQALEAANYSKGAVRKSTSMPVVKNCMKEILEEFKLSDLTPDFIIKDIEKGKKLCIKGKKKDLSTFMRGCELEGKYLKMFADTANTTILVNIQGNQFNLVNRLDKLKSQHKDAKAPGKPA